MGWLGRLFDARDTFVRMVLLDLTGLCYLLFGTQAEHPPPATQWALAVCAFAAALICHRRRELNLILQTVLLAVGFVLIDDQMINQVGAGWALLELAMWAPKTVRLWQGTALLTLVYVVNGLNNSLRELSHQVFGLTVVVGLPLLLGLVIRTTRELSRQAGERALAENRATRADERSAIARELHDVVAHHVASMVLRVGVARHVLPDLDPKVNAVFDDVHSTGSAALADLRKLVEVLRDPDGVRPDAALTVIEPAALPAALSGAVETARRNGLLVDAEIAPAAGTLDAVRGAAVLRLTQEALTNVAKHAGTAARARLLVEIRDGDVHWSVTDDGGGSPAGGGPPGGGHGVTGMRERVALLGGVLEAGPYESGWRVRTVLPHATSAATGDAA